MIGEAGYPNHKRTEKQDAFFESRIHGFALLNERVHNSQSMD